jgi:hypothetical protein
MNVKIKNIYETVILCAVLYECEPGSLTLKEKHRLRVFDMWALRKIFVPKREEGTGNWRILRNKELYDLYSTTLFW